MRMRLIPLMRMLPREMRTDVMPGALDVSSPADDSVEAAQVPTLPTQDVLPKAVPVALSLESLGGGWRSSWRFVEARDADPKADL